MPLTTYHIVYKELKWHLEKENAGKSTRVFNSQEEAVKFAIPWLRNSATIANPNQLYIHSKSGKLRTETYYPKSADPRNSKG